jgi:hypothetical protein
MGSWRNENTGKKRHAEEEKTPRKIFAAVFDKRIFIAC